MPGLGDMVERTPDDWAEAQKAQVATWDKLSQVQLLKEAEDIQK